MDRTALACKGLKIDLSRSGKIESLYLDDINVKSSCTNSGFYLKDVRDPYWSDPAGSDINELALIWSAHERDEFILFDVSIENTALIDKFLTLEYRIPVHISSGMWGQSINKSEAIQEGNIYTNKSDFNRKFSNNLYPFGCIFNERSGISIAVPMDKMRFYHFSYSATEGGYLSVKYDFALSGINDFGAKSCDFSFLIYRSGRNGFRDCALRYYEIFPEYFSRKVEKSGNWIFTQDYSSVENLSDFHIAFNESPNIDLDHMNGISSFKYIAPSEKWIAFEDREKEPEPSYDEYIERLEENCRLDDSVMDYDHGILPLKMLSETVKLTSILNSDNKYQTDGWYVYGPMVNFVVNGDPDIEGVNFARTREMELEIERERFGKHGQNLDGIYIDNVNWVFGTQNYRREHFKYSKLPLLWDDDFRICEPLAMTQYKFIEYFRGYADKHGMLILANFAFPELGSVHYIHKIDIPGGEIGDGWGDSIEELAMRRVLAYKKPWVLLLTQFLPYGKRVDWNYERRENLLRKCVLYGIYANVIQLQSKKDDFEFVRPLFKKYMPIIKELDLAGWQIISDATADSDDVFVESFGSSDCRYYSIYNSGTSRVVLIRIPVEGEGFLHKTAIELFAGTNISFTDHSDGYVSLSLHIDENDCAVIKI